MMNVLVLLTLFYLVFNIKSDDSHARVMRKYNGFFVHLETLLREWGMTGGMV